MSNLASRSHEWVDWQIEELLLELPIAPKSRAKRKQHFRIKLSVKWCDLGQRIYILKRCSSPTQKLLKRDSVSNKDFKAARILASKLKDSHGGYTASNPELLALI
ncbi:MAG: hypothetical protein R3A80_04745 [Bdellovibrionota bacterium]